jgi:Family of unknown function (DUF6011)
LILQEHVMPFETASIPPIPFLAELREEVLKHSLKRMPKWKFRFAPDIVVQLQPQPALLLSAAATERELTDWFVHQTSGRWQHSAGRSGWVTLFERIVAALRDGYFTASMPPRMLSHHCMICGKGLTDPASMARWIGPECAGTSTLHVPFLITLDRTHAAALATEAVR